MKQIPISDPAVWYRLRCGTQNFLVVPQTTAPFDLHESVELQGKSPYDGQAMADRPMTATVGASQDLPSGDRVVALLHVAR